MCLPAQAALSSSEVSGAAFKLYACYCAHREGFEALVSNEQAHEDTGIGYAYISTLKFELLEAGWIGLSKHSKKGVVPLKGFEEEALNHIRTSRKLSKIERTIGVSNIESSSEKVSNIENSGDVEVSKSETNLSKNESFENRKNPPVPPYKDKNTSTESSSATLRNSAGLSADEGEVEKRARALRKAIAEIPRRKHCAQPKPEEWSLILDIFAEWRRVMGKNGNAKLTPERGRAVLDRLRSPVGFTREDFSKAILGCRASPRHMGQNERGEVYDDLELICRSDQNLERFIGYGETEATNGKSDAGVKAGAGGNPAQAGNGQPSRREQQRAELRRQAATPMFTGTPTRRAD